jgi:hypothetical protein
MGIVGRSVLGGELSGLEDDDPSVGFLAAVWDLVVIV